MVGAVRKARDWRPSSTNVRTGSREKQHITITDENDGSEIPKTTNGGMKEMPTAAAAASVAVMTQTWTYVMSRNSSVLRDATPCTPVKKIQTFGRIILLW